VRTRPALVLAMLSLAALPRPAAALAMVDFASSDGAFGIQALTIDFGDDLEVTAARDGDDVADPSVLGFAVELDPVALLGTFTHFPSLGLYIFDVDTSSPYQLRIHDDTGLTLTADFDPGDFVTVTASGVLSPAVGPEVGNVQNLNPGLYPSLDDLALGLSIDLNVTLSAAGRDAGALIVAGDPVTGSVAGTLVVTEAPEPGTMALFASGALGLLWLGRRR